MMSLLLKKEFNGKIKTPQQGRVFVLTTQSSVATGYTKTD